jgi:O-acetyl-ADP-ribose deacetylase (regulator of RNase III)
MRLHATFRKQRLDPKVIETHIEKLEHAQRKIGLDLQTPDRPARDAFHASSLESPTRVRIAYGDVTTASSTPGDDWADCRRAIVSPEDTTISAGGGVALRLLTRAGPRQLLNELAKLSPIPQGSCAVTSAGNLPVPDILHAAALRILEDGVYDINPEQIERSIVDALRVAEALQVGATWVPLLGAGVADIPPADSLAAIMRAIFNTETRLPNRTITIVIYQETILGREAVRTVLRSTLPTGYAVREE